MINEGQHSKAITVIEWVAATFWVSTFLPQMSSMGIKGVNP